MNRDGEFGWKISMTLIERKANLQKFNSKLNKKSLKIVLTPKTIDRKYSPNGVERLVDLKKF